VRRNLVLKRSSGSRVRGDFLAARVIAPFPRESKLRLERAQIRRSSLKGKADVHSVVDRIAARREMQEGHVGQIG
jgi:hypothetical protein